MKKFKILALLAVMAILWTIPAMAFAQEVPPAVVIGTASNNGVPVAAGTTITAHVSGSDVGSALTSAGGKFQVTAKGVKGDTLTFTIGEATASESIKLADSGEILRQDLSVGANSGSAGSAGSKGAAGAKGDSGAKGDTGAAGAAGPSGAAGAAGAAGPAGAAGASGADGTSGGGSMGIIALILAIVAIVVAGAGFFMRKQS